MLLVSESGDRSPVRHCGTDAPVLFEEHGLQIHDVRVSLSLHFVAAEPRATRAKKNWDARKSTRLVSVILGGTGAVI